jgi:cyclohexadienyl dehydratase
VLRIGTPGDYAPFAMLRERRLEGSDVDLAGRLAAALGLRPVFIASRWATLVDDLEADRFDVAIGGISITDARRTRASFSLPLARGGKTAIGRCRDRDRLGTWNAIDQRGVRVIENAGGTNEGFARRRLQHAALVVHPDNRTVFAELSEGRADVMFTDDTEITLVTHQRPELCRLLVELYDPAEKAIMLPRDGSWAGDVDGWLQQAIAQGLPAALLAEHLTR